MNEEYVLELYSYLGSADETFQDNLSQEDFVEAMKQKQYAAQIYQYLGNLDEDYKNQVPVQDFMTAIGIGEVKVDPLNPEVKKKTIRNLLRDLVLRTHPPLIHLVLTAICLILVSTSMK